MKSITKIFKHTVTTILIVACVSPQADAQLLIDETWDFHLEPQIVLDPMTQGQQTPFSGHFEWRTLNVVPLCDSAPTGCPSAEAYQRYVWSTFESSTEGVYDFSKLKQAIVAAANKGQRFAFRIQTLGDPGQASLPAYMRNNRAWYGIRSFNSSGGVATDIPSWGNPNFVARLRSLHQALRLELANANLLRYIAYVDIGTYGLWGEWHLSGFDNQAKALPSEKPALVDAVYDAFHDVPDSYLLMLTDDVDAFSYAIQKSDRIGIRRDSLGRQEFGSKLRQKYMPLPAIWNILQNRYQTAPFIAEFAGSFGQGDTTRQAYFQQALQDVMDWHVTGVGNGNQWKVNGLSVGWSDRDPLTNELYLDQNALKNMHRMGFRPAVVSASVKLPGFLLTEPMRIELNVINKGNAPFYLPAQARVILKEKSSGYVVNDNTYAVDLQSLQYSDTYAWKLLPRTVLQSNATYQLWVQFKTTTQPQQIIALGNTIKDNNGFYQVGEFTINGSDVLKKR